MRIETSGSTAGEPTSTTTSAKVALVKTMLLSIRRFDADYDKRIHWKRVLSEGALGEEIRSEGRIMSDSAVHTCPVCLGPRPADERYCDDCRPNSGWDE